MSLIENYDEYKKKKKLTESNYIHVMKALDEMIGIFYEIMNIDKQIKRM